MDPATRRILDASLAVLGRYGYRAATMGQVASEAGVARQSLYNRFADKEALFRATAADLHERTLAAAQAASAQADPVGAIYALLESRYGPFVDLLHDAPHGAELISESDRLCGDESRRATERFRALLKARLEQADLDLAGAGLTATDLAELLIRGVYGLKAPDPVRLTPALFRKRLRQLVHLVVHSLSRSPR